MNSDDEGLIDGVITDLFQRRDKDSAKIHASAAALHAAVNGDGYVSPLDALRILTWAMGTEPHPSAAYGLGHTLDTPDVMYPIVHGWAQGDWNADGIVVCGPSREEVEALELDPVATSAKVPRLDDGQPLVELAIDPTVFEDPRAVDARVGVHVPDDVNGRLVALGLSDDTTDSARGGRIVFVVAVSIKDTFEKEEWLYFMIPLLESHE